ncbi:MAG: MFS transporter [Planctomycetota bacterium]|jgi:HEAT repeat protein
MLQNEITPADRVLGQKYAVRANLGMGLIGHLVVHAFMMLYATDVLGFSATKISFAAALLPLITILRIPILNVFKKFTKVTIIKFSDTSNIICIALIMMIPAQHMSFYLFVIIITFFCFFSRVGIQTVWQPLLKDITTDNDRSRFFSRMRLAFNVFTTASMALISFLIGSSITEIQYKLLLGIAVLAYMNHMYWAHFIPEKKSDSAEEQSISLMQNLKIFWEIIRFSPVMRRPFIICMLSTPMMLVSFTVYLKKILFVPSNVVSLYVMCGTLGAGLGLTVWGKITDTIGFRPVKIGLRILFIMTMFVMLLVAPYSQNIQTWQDMNIIEFYSSVILCFFGIVTGMLLSGIYLCVTTFMHFSVDKKKSLEEMTVFLTLYNIVWGLAILTSGVIIDRLAVPAGSWSILNDFIHLDYFKLYIFLIVVPMQIIGILLLRKITDARSYFRIVDFFSSLTPYAMRTMVFQKNIYNESEDKRMETAYRLGSNITPMSIDPMTELLSDASYDVKVCAIQGLARSKSDLAGEKLLEMLKDHERLQLADHAAWALGELRYQPASEELTEKLDPLYSSRIRAMAARALGKLGYKSAIPELVKILEKSDERPHLISSACKALLRLEDDSRAELYFKIISLMRDREERFEIIDSLCPMLDIPNDWLLKYTSDSKVAYALLQYISLQTKKWQEEKAKVTSVIEDLNIDKFKQLLADDKEKDIYNNNKVVVEMLKSVDDSDEWNAVTSLAAAWYVLKNKT